MPQKAYVLRGQGQGDSMSRRVRKRRIRPTQLLNEVRRLAFEVATTVALFVWLIRELLHELGLR